MGSMPVTASALASLPLTSRPGRVLLNCCARPGSIARKSFIRKRQSELLVTTDLVLEIMLPGRISVEQEIL